MNPQPSPQTRLSITGQAGQMQLTVFPGLTPDHVNLKSPDHRINLKIPHAMLPSMELGDSIIVTLSLVRVAVTAEPESGILTPPSLLV